MNTEISSPLLWIDAQMTPVHPAEDELPILHVATAKEADAALSDSSQCFAAILIDPVLTAPGGVHLIAQARKARPCTPIYILSDGTPHFGREEADRLGITDTFPRAEALPRILRALAPECFMPPLARSEPGIQTGSDYIAVPATDFLTGLPSVFDIHVRLPSGKHLKIVDAKDVFSPSRALAYIRKGVAHFHLKTASYRRSLSYCDSLARYLLTREKISIPLKASELLNQGESILAQISNVAQDGPTDIHLEYVLDFISGTHALVKDIRLNDQQTVEQILRQCTAYENAVASAMIAGLLALPMKIEAASTFKTLGLAALLQDIGLSRMPKEIRHHDVRRMSETQRALFETHPIEGAKILKKNAQIEDTVLQAVAQHHERRDNLGFPRQSKATEINRVAEMIGMSSEFASLLRRAKTEPDLHPIDEMEKSVFDGYSYPVVQAFRTVFMNRARPN